MDMSKLPRMSQTPPPPPAEPPSAYEEGPATRGVAAAGYQYAPEPVGGSLAEAWISIAIGMILLFIYPYFWQWLISLVSDYQPPFLPITQFDPQTGATTEIPYAQSIFFFSNLCVFAFALVLIMDGVILFTRRPALLMFAFGFTLVTTLLNFLCVANETMQGRGFPIASALAVAFGVYIAIFQWKLLQALRMTQPVAR